jgi:hypothetical protein
MKKESLARYRPSPEEKADALGSVFYEIQRLWASSHLAGEPAPVMNAFLESMLLHVRVLLDFFERESRSRFGPRAARKENDDVLSSAWLAKLISKLTIMSVDLFMQFISGSFISSKIVPPTTVAVAYVGLPCTQSLRLPAGCDLPIVPKVDGDRFARFSRVVQQGEIVMLADLFVEPN